MQNIKTQNITQTNSIVGRARESLTAGYSAKEIRGFSDGEALALFERQVIAEADAFVRGRLVHI